MNEEIIKTEALFPITGRAVFLVSMLSAILLGTASVLVTKLIGISNMKGLAEFAFCMVLYIPIGLILIKMSLNKKVDLYKLIGKVPTGKDIFRFLPIAFPLIGISMGLIFLIYLPLSFMFPNFVHYCLSDDSTLYFPNGSQLTNSISFFSVVIIAPIVEEFIFRGLLLTRWSSKWGTQRSILVSSIIFGVLHGPSTVSLFFVGLVLSFVYIKTRSLIIPILLHAGNNLFAFLLHIIESKDLYTAFSVSDFQNNWWMGALCLIIGIPWLICFFRKNWLIDGMKIPYFENIRLEMN
jgi:uncharacterized protein